MQLRSVINFIVMVFEILFCCWWGILSACAILGWFCLTESQEFSTKFMYWQKFKNILLRWPCKTSNTSKKLKTFSWTLTIVFVREMKITLYMRRLISNFLSSVTVNCGFFHTFPIKMIFVQNILFWIKYWLLKRGAGWLEIFNQNYLDKSEN